MQQPAQPVSSPLVMKSTGLLAPMGTRLMPRIVGEKE